jgi:flagellar motor component MotA
MDITALLGVVIATGSILGGRCMDAGHGTAIPDSDE